MKPLTVAFDSNTDPNIIGEFLRRKFFTPEHLYCCGEFNNDVEQLPDEPVPWVDFLENGDSFMVTDRHDPDDPKMFTVAKWGDIKARHYWDGDGHLEFVLPDGTIVLNSDCKKDHGWVFVDSVHSKQYFWETM